MAGPEACHVGRAVSERGAWNFSMMAGRHSTCVSIGPDRQTVSQADLRQVSRHGQAVCCTLRLHSTSDSTSALSPSSESAQTCAWG